jgi:two-component sensor histidine kinase/integral membrane sensor domain MASE1
MAAESSILWHWRTLLTAVVTCGSMWLGVNVLQGYSGGAGEPLVSPIWPATGIRLGLLWLWGFRVLPGIIVGVIAGNALIFDSTLVAAAYVPGHIIEAVLPVWLIRRWTGTSRPTLDSPRSAVAFLAASLIGPAAAIAIAFFLFLLSIVPALARGEGDWRFWTTWFISDVLSAIIITPVIISWFGQRSVACTARPRLQAVCLAVLVPVTSFVVFFGGFSNGWLRPEPLLFLTLPLIAWAALVFLVRGASLAVFVVSVIAVIGTLNTRGPFAMMPSLLEAALLLQVYLGVSAVTALLLAVVTAERARMHERVRLQHVHVQHLLSELDHRVRNNLATLTGLVDLSVQSSPAPSEMSQIEKSAAGGFSLAAFRSRVQAMSRVHTVLSRSQWAPALLSELVTGVVAPVAPAEKERLTLAGTDPVFDAERCQAIALSLHELATNARRHGAWSNQHGAVTIRGGTLGDVDEIEWIESGVNIPEHLVRASSNGESLHGTSSQIRGITLMRGFITHELGGHLELIFKPGGLHVRISLPRRPSTRAPLGTSVIMPRGA